MLFLFPHQRKEIIFSRFAVRIQSIFKDCIKYCIMVNSEFIVYQNNIMLLLFLLKCIRMYTVVIIVVVLSSNVVSLDIKSFAANQKFVPHLLQLRTKDFDRIRKKHIFALIGSLCNLFSTQFCGFRCASADDQKFSAVTNVYDNRYKEFNEVWKITNENFYDSSHNNIDWMNIRNDYISRLESGADEHELTKKLVQLLGDKYTRLLDKSVFESLWKYDAIGVGLLFQSEPNKPMFVAAPPISGSSAGKAGIKQNDAIYSINGVSTEGMTAVQLLDMMSNDDRDTVTLEYGPDRKLVTLPRSKQKATNPVSFYSQKLKNGKVCGYVSLKEFNSESVPGLKAALTQLTADGADEILLDLRGNTGGGFQFALNIGGMFMVFPCQ